MRTTPRHLGLAAAACLTLVYACSATEVRTAQRTADPSPSPETTIAPPTALAAEVQYRVVRRYLGRVEAERDAWLSSTTGGRVARVEAAVGQRVMRGALLVALAPGELRFAARATQREREAARALLGPGVVDAAATPEVDAARASLRAADDALTRVEALREADAASAQDLTRARAERDAAQAALAGAESAAAARRSVVAQLDAAIGQRRVQLDELRVRAPFDGVVAARAAVLGALTAPGAPLVRLVDPSSHFVRVDVPQAEAAQTPLGARARVEADGRGVGAVLARRTDGLLGVDGALRAELTFDDPTEAPWPVGAWVHVALETGEAVRGVAIDADALGRQAGAYVVELVDGARVERRVVDVDRVVDGRAIVRRGLRAGERAIVRTGRAPTAAAATRGADGGASW
jgi:HlyD family secretion protein